MKSKTIVKIKERKATDIADKLTRRCLQAQSSRRKVDACVGVLMSMVLNV